MVNRRPSVAGVKNGVSVGIFECARRRKSPHPMMYAGAGRNILLGLSGDSFSARNQMPGGEWLRSISQGRIEAASPRRRPRDSATRVMASVQQSSMVVGVLVRRDIYSNHDRRGSPRMRSAAIVSTRLVVYRI